MTTLHSIHDELYFLDSDTVKVGKVQKIVISASGRQTVPIEVYSVNIPNDNRYYERPSSLVFKTKADLLASL